MTTPATPFSPLALDRDRGAPLHRRLSRELREAVLSGRLAAESRLPSSRDLARELGLSRNTVLDALGQLVAEGYLEARPRSGTFVRADLPRTFPPPGQATSTAGVVLSRRGRRLCATRAGAEDSRLPLCPGVPALDEFPRALWARMMSAVLRREPASRLNYGDVRGHPPLREAIVATLAAARGVRATASQVLVVSGAQQALDLVARVLLDRGDRAWIEDPGYVGARAALEGAGVRPVAVPVDGEGLDVRVGRRRAPRARLAYVSPSHQYPLAVTMSLPRRLQLLEWAKEARAFVIEDDYGSEFRYQGRPAPALQGLDPAAAVLYLGTFSKALFPGLRLGYVVAPPHLADAFARARRTMDGGPPVLEQAVLARFLAEGHFGRHVRRMRALYRERREELLHQAARHLAGLVEIGEGSAGLHVVGWLPPSWDDAEVAAALAARGLGPPPLSAYAIERPCRPALVLGFASLRPRAIVSAVRTMAAVLESYARGRRSGGEARFPSRDPSRSSR
jgi:GntR family transcriptional regulator/MocR family aminotransferase